MIFIPLFKFTSSINRYYFSSLAFAAGFFAAAFLAAGFLAAAFLATGFLAGTFLATDFFSHKNKNKSLFFHICLTS